MRQCKRRAIARVGVEALEGRTLCAANPVALSPGTATGAPANLTTLTPTLTWSAVAGVNGYQVRVLDRTAGTYAAAATVGSSATSYAVPSGKLTAGHAFQWSVWDVIGKATVSPSAKLQFRTPIPLPAVAAALVGTGNPARPMATTLRPTISWSGVANVSGYVLHVYDNSTKAVITHNVAAKSTSYTFADGELTPGHAYNWNVRDLIGTATDHHASNTERFQVPPLPTVTALSPGTAGGPGTVLTTFTPTFTWTAVKSVAGFSNYLLTLYDRTTGQATPVTVASTATSYTLPAGQLIAGHRYVWNVRVVAGTITGKVVPSAFRAFVAPLVGG